MWLDLLSNEHLIFIYLFYFQFIINIISTFCFEL